MSKRAWGMHAFRVGAAALALPFIVDMSPAAAQWYAPQSDRDLRLNWSVERLGPSRVLILGDIQNLSEYPVSGVILRAEGVDPAGKVVSRGRSSVHAEIPPHGSSFFEIRLATSGSEHRYRVTVDSFEFLDPRRRERHSP